MEQPATPDKMLHLFEHGNSAEIVIVSAEVPSVQFVPDRETSGWYNRNANGVVKWLFFRATIS